jgi:hypothetical protein
VTFVSRADDLGSSESANRAIEMVAEAGFIKNVSVMAPGPFAEQAAQMLAKRKDVCFGMHTTLNAEWDKVKWAPVLPPGEDSGLVDANGNFLPNPSFFAKTKPPVEIIMREVDAQLERLHSLGFDIRYIDSHMFPEMFVEGLDEAMEDFARKKGLIDHMYFYVLPPGFEALQQNSSGIIKFLRSLPAGQYFIAAHPSLDTEEMRQTGNAQYSGEDIAKGRAAETQIFSKKSLRHLMKILGCDSARYDKAKPLPKRLGIEDAKAMLDNEKREN